MLSVYLRNKKIIEFSPELTEKLGLEQKHEVWTIPPHNFIRLYTSVSFKKTNYTRIYIYIS